MITHANQTNDQKSTAVSPVPVSVQDHTEGILKVENLRPEASIQRKIQQLIDNSPQVSQFKKFQQMANKKPEPAQLKPFLNKEASTNGEIVQRDVSNAKYDETNAAHKNAAMEFFNTFDACTARAFHYVISVPSLGPLKDLNGYTQLWFAKWNEFIGGGAPKLMAATFGYVIESLVSDSRSNFRPPAPAGYSILTQIPVGGTRPDLVLADTTSAKHIAWLDLTASSSVDHIFSKDGWDEKISMYAEVSYPSLDPSLMALMKQNKDNQGAIDPEVFKARVEEARKAYVLKKAKWIELGKTYAFSNLKKEIGRTSEDMGLDPTIPREFIRRRLISDFKAGDLEEKMVPSVLAAMKVSALSWKYELGFAQSEKAGEAWLTDNDVTVEDTEDYGANDVEMSDSKDNTH